jgi:hypothetical protein
MRERLIQYVELLFAGAPGAEEMKQEILQNTLDRYDDLISQGKTEESAYRLAITGIGDINELLAAPVQEDPSSMQEQGEPAQVRKLRATAIALYISSAIPLFLLGGLGSGTIGLSLTVLLAAIATYLMILSRRSEPNQRQNAPKIPKDPRKDKISKILSPISLVIYFLVSFTTHAWAITWLIFPISGCVEGLILAICDLKEGDSYEN